MVGAGTKAVTEVSINFGSSIAGLLIPVVGPAIVVMARQLVTVIVLAPFWRPRLRGLSLRTVWPAIALGVVLAIMNFSFYEAVGRLGLGVAVTIEFLGPLVLALSTSRRILDLACVVGAGIGVYILIGATGDLDLLGVAFALTAAAGWATYILLARKVAMQFTGLGGLTIASIVSLGIVAPFALATINFSAFTWAILGLLLAVGVLSSAIPYGLDTFVLRRITPRLYAIITSLGPAIAALFGALVLSERLGALQWFAIALVCASAGTAIATQRDRRVSVLEAAAATTP